MRLGKFGWGKKWSSNYKAYFCGVLKAHITSVGAPLSCLPSPRFSIIPLPSLKIEKVATPLGMCVISAFPLAVDSEMLQPVCLVISLSV